MMTETKFTDLKPEWIRKPKQVTSSDDCIEVITESGTDLWQRTYYGFRNDNAPVLQAKTDEKYFSFIVKTQFESKDRFDQCGVAMYLDSDNWFKASIEYENERIQRLGSVVTNNGYSDMNRNLRRIPKLIRKAGIENLEEIANLAVLMWTENTVQDLVAEFSDTISKEDAQFFLKYNQDILVGFAQCQLRYDYVEGTDTSPVGYLEGIFVKEEYRHKGYAKELLSECEKWAKEKGCKEFASDCEINNDSSFGFHMALGFKEANRIIYFTNQL